ncbi:MAG TPA: DUF2569 family protein [Acidobacteriaceae bacterium]|nr:DUF2569 family protein [Acidobacteriaceae bacterium]
MLIDQTEWERTPEGLGGWLILLLLAMWISAAALLASGVSALLPLFHHAPVASFPRMSPFTAALAVAAGIFGAVAGYLLIRKNPLGPTVARTLLALTAGYSLMVLLATIFRVGPVPAESVPAWVEPTGYLLASVLGLGYLLRSSRVAKTYRSQPEDSNLSSVSYEEDLSDVLQTRLRRWEELRSAENPPSQPSEPNLPVQRESNPETRQESTFELFQPEPGHDYLQHFMPADRPIPPTTSSPEMTPPLKTLSSRNHAVPDTQELTALKTQIADGISLWLTSTAAKPEVQATLFGEPIGPASAEKIRRKLLDQVNTICDQAWSVHIGDSPTLPNTPESEGSLPREIQKWAIAQAVFRLTRSLDIRAALEVYGPFEKVAEDHAFLMAVGQKNSSEDAFGRKVDLAEYEGHSGPEIAYKLILRAQRDMFEADMWSRVASLAGDPDFLNRFSGGGARAYEESLEYWRGYANRMRDERVPAAHGL